MAVSQVLWSLDDKSQLLPASLTDEKELEELLFQHTEILNPNWLLIGRQVRTTAGKYIDLLCMDRDGDLIVVELKKDQTPREVTAQVIDYASCVSEIKLEQLAELYLQLTGGQETLNEAYEKKFGVTLDEDGVNENTKMVIVAARMDDSTERIVRYLREKYEVDINILFFNIFAYNGHRFISRVWFEEDIEEQLPAPRSARGWNQEYYVSFGAGERRWEDAQKYGFISAGGGAWYSNTLKLLSAGDRVWVNIPHTGYVGVGLVAGEAVQAKDAVLCVDGEECGLSRLALKGNYLYASDEPDKAEYIVPVRWLKTVPEARAVKEAGFFGNQNTVCRPKDQKWVYTVERLKTLWKIDT